MCGTDTGARLVDIQEHRPFSRPPRQILGGYIHRPRGPTGRLCGLGRLAAPLRPTWALVWVAEMFELAWWEPAQGEPVA